jgi:thiol-disulfide isomerase/thioredoxin
MILGKRTFLRRALLGGAAALPVWQIHSESAYELISWPRHAAAPPLNADDLVGRTWRLEELHGRGILLNFWASWCGPCRAEMATLQTLADLNGPAKLAVLTINFKESAATATRFVEATGLSLPVLLDPAGKTARSWRINVFPTTVVIGTDGKPLCFVRGEMNWTSQAAGKIIAPLLQD